MTTPSLSTPPPDVNLSLLVPPNFKLTSSGCVSASANPCQVRSRSYTTTGKRKDVHDAFIKRIAHAGGNVLMDNCKENGDLCKITIEYPRRDSLTPIGISIRDAGSGSILVQLLIST
jgi:hypothetical protein